MSRTDVNVHIVMQMVDNNSVSLPTLREVIGTHLAVADPHVLTAHDCLDVPVEWVHSSEIYEIGPLLSGGELLLTTGLGLAGLDAGTRRHYVRDLAERGVVGIAFEIGRSFDAVPDEMIAAGSLHRLPIIQLRRIVPFIRVCRAANTAIVSDEVTHWRQRAKLDRALHDALIGGGVAAMLGHLAEATGGPIVLIGSGGALLAAHGVDDDRAAWRLVDQARASVDIEVRGRVVGQLVAGPFDTSKQPPAESDSDSTGLSDGVLAVSQQHLEDLLSMAAGPVASALHRPESRALLAGPQLIADLIAGRPLRRADLVARLSSSGVTITKSSYVVPVAAESPDARMASSVLSNAAGAIGMRIVQSTVDATVHALIVGSDETRRDDRDPVDDIVTALACARAGLGGVSAAVSDPIPIGGAHGHGTEVAIRLGAGIRRAAELLAIGMEISRDAAAGRSVFAARELAADVAVRAIAADERSHLLGLIAPLVAQDEVSSSDLVRTIDVHLRHGCSATRSAAALHIGRQSLYQRLERIRTLLGFDPTTPEVYTSILLAVSVFRAGKRR